MKKFILMLLICVVSFGQKVKEVTITESQFQSLVGDLEMGTPNKRWEAAELLGDAGNCKAVPYLIKALQKDNVPRVRWTAAEALGKLGDRAAEGALKDALQDPVAEVRYAAGEALARLRSAEGISIIVQALRDTTVDYHRRERIAEALGILGDERGVSALVAVLNDPVSPRVREQAAYALGKLRAEEAVSALATRLDYREETQPQCRVAAAVAIGQIYDKSKGIPALAKALNDPDAKVKEAASKSLSMLVHKTPTSKELDKNVIPILIELLEFEDTREYAEATIDSFLQRSTNIPLLAKIVGSGKRNARLYAIRKIEESKSCKGVLPLVEALEDPDSIVRARAAVAIGKLKCSEAVKPLVAFTNDSSIIVAKAAIAALGEIGDPACRNTLFRIIRDRERVWDVRIVCAQAIGHLPSNAVIDTLLIYSKDADEEVRYLAVVGLGELKDKRALKTLTYISDNDPVEKVREAARIAVSRIEEKPFKRTY